MTESQIQLFNNPEFGGVRGCEEPDGTIWVVAKDVAKALEYPESSLAQLSNLLAKVPDAWKGHKQIKTLGGEQNVLILTEQGLYFFLARSDKPKALPFQMWLANDVVPSIRKTGSYSIELPQTYAAALRALADKAEALEAAEAAKQAAIEALTVTEEQRDKAVREKSWIGSKREATAMATAATAIKKAIRLDAENDCLREQIGDSRDWKSVKAQGKTLRRYFDLTRPGVYVAIGKRMSRLSTSMGKGKLALEDSQYGTTGAYHIDVWDRFFATCKTDLNFMRSYRRQYQASLCGGNE